MNCRPEYICTFCRCTHRRPRLMRKYKSVAAPNAASFLPDTSSVRPSDPAVVFEHSRSRAARTILIVRSWLHSTLWSRLKSKLEGSAAPSLRRPTTFGRSALSTPHPPNHSRNISNYSHSLLTAKSSPSRKTRIPNTISRQLVRGRSHDTDTTRLRDKTEHALKYTDLRRPRARIRWYGQSSNIHLQLLSLSHFSSPPPRGVFSNACELDTRIPRAPAAL